MIVDNKDQFDGLSVVHVVLSLDCGGLERVVIDLVREGHARGQRVAVACVDRPGALAGEVERLGATVVCAAKPPGLAIGAVGRMQSLLKELNPDVIHSHQIGALLYTGPAARRLNIPLVVHTEHGKHYDGSARRRLLGRLAGRYATRFFCVSEDIAAGVLRHRVVPRRKIGVVRNGIDVARFTDGGGPAETRHLLGIPPNASVIGTVGRLSEVKRQDRLLVATARLVADGRDVHLLVVGDGELREDLRRRAESLKIGTRAHFAGYQAEPGRYLGTMDVFALTSRSEGMPLAILEAWAAGLPVVASRVGGVPELVEHGFNGLLFEPDDEAALASAIGCLLDNKEFLRSLSEAGRTLVTSTFSLRRMYEIYHVHYLDLLQGRSRAGLAASSLPR